MTWTAALLYLFVTSGLPLPLLGTPVDTATKDRSEPFICMDSQCGCHDAEQCWQSCCCHSLAERVAWARARGASIPADVLAAMARSSTAQDTSGKACAAPSDAGEPAAPSCCSDDAPAAPLATQSDCQACGAEDQPKRPAGSRSVILVRALACQGVGLNLFMLAPAIPLVLCDDNTRPAPTAWACATVSPVVALHHQAPPIPPPRCADV